MHGNLYTALLLLKSFGIKLYVFRFWDCLGHNGKLELSMFTNDFQSDVGAGAVELVYQHLPRGGGIF